MAGFQCVGRLYWRVWRLSFGEKQVSEAEKQDHPGSLRLEG
jgi:hypothetical protein